MLLFEGGIHFAVLSLAQNEHFPLSSIMAASTRNPCCLCVRLELFRQRTSNQFIDVAALPTYRKSHETMWC